MKGVTNMSGSNMARSRTLAEIVVALNLLLLMVPMIAFLEDILKSCTLSLVYWKMTPESTFRLYVNSTLTYACSGATCMATLEQTKRLYWTVTAMLGLWTLPQFIAGADMMISVNSTTLHPLTAHKRISAWITLQKAYIVGECFIFLLTLRYMTLPNVTLYQFTIAGGLAVFIGLLETIRGVFCVVIKLFQSYLLNVSSVSVIQLV